MHAFCKHAGRGSAGRSLATHGAQSAESSGTASYALTVCMQGTCGGDAEGAGSRQLGAACAQRGPRWVGLETSISTVSRNAAQIARRHFSARVLKGGVSTFMRASAEMRVSAKAQRACGERRPVDSGCLWGWLKARAEGHAVQARVPRQ